MDNWKLINFCEFDKYAMKSYCAIHDIDESKNLGDINNVDENKLELFNMICGGSPCQDFSVAGKQKGSKWTCEDCGHEYNPLTVHWSERNQCPACGSENLEKTRSSLLVEYLRVIRANRPNFGMYENVKNIVGKKFQETFQMFTQELEEYGYNVYWKVLDAKDYGIPQHRERVYVIFVKKELDNGRFKFPEPFQNKSQLKDFLENDVDEKFYVKNEKVKSCFYQMDNVFDKSTECRLKQVGYIDNNGEANRVYADICARTLKAEAGGGGAKTGLYVEHFPINEEADGTCRTIKAQYGTSMANYKCKGSFGATGVGKVKIKQATKTGYIECDVGGVFDASYPESTTRRGRVQGKGQISPTITASGTGICRIECDFRIRKLTPKECFRLMGFQDSDYEAAKNEGISNSQLYKQAGNSIVVDVLYYILKELYQAMPYLFEDLRLSSFFSGIGAFEKALDRLYMDMQIKNSDVKYYNSEKCG